MGPPEVATGEPLNHAVESLGPVEFLDVSNSLILYFIKNITLGNLTTLLILPGFRYVISITTKFDGTPVSIPLYYYNFLGIFKEINTNFLPTYQPCVNYTINFIPG